MARTSTGKGKGKPGAPAVAVLEMVKTASVKRHPENPRVGDVEAIKASIIALGVFYSAIVVQKSTRLVIAGNHRHLAAEQLGIAEIPAAVVDVDPFGAPFEHLWILAKRRPIAKGERVGLVITCGALGSRARMSKTMAGSTVGIARAQLGDLGIDPLSSTKHYTMENGHRLLMRAVSRWFAPASIVSWCGYAANTIRYDGVVIVG